MNKVSICRVIIFLLSTFSLLNSVVFAKTVLNQEAEVLYPKSYALVIGVNQPSGEWSSLSSAQDDAQLFGDHLERRGFEVIRLVGEKANKVGILKQLQTILPQKIGSHDRFIFYFAGHGQTQVTKQGKKIGYIVPADGSMIKSQDQWHTYLSMRELKSLLTEHIPSKHTLLLFDSCFSGLMFTRGVLRRPNLGAKAHLSKKGVMAITAGAAGELALDGLFTPTLIQALSGEADENMDGITSFQEIALYTRREVQARRDQQTPQFGILTGSGQMIFESKTPKISLRPSNIGAQSPRLSTSQKITNGEFTSNKQWGIIALSGTLAMALGGGLIWHSLNRLDEIEGIEDDKAYNKRVGEKFGSISSEYTAGWVIGGVGLASLGWSLYQVITQPVSYSTASSFTPMITPESVTFSWVW
jgi:hypothetical protein